MSGIEGPSNSFVTDVKSDKDKDVEDQSADLPAAPAESIDEAGFDWLGGPAERQAAQEAAAASASFQDPESEAIWGTVKKLVPVQVRVTFFVLVGGMFLVPSILGLLGTPLPHYFGVGLHIYTITGLTILYFPGLILTIVRAIAKGLRRSLLWSKTELPSYLDSISIPLCVAVCGSILYGLWAIELPVCVPEDPNCYWKYVHRMYYVMLGSCAAFSFEVALMKKWCNNYRRQTYQSRIVDNRFKCYVVEQMKMAARARKQQAIIQPPTPQAQQAPHSQSGLGGILSKMAGYAPIPQEVTRIAHIRDFEWFQKQVNSVMLMEHYQKFGGESQTVSDMDARKMAKEIFEALCPEGREYLTKDDFAGFVPPDALDDSYYVFDHDRDGEVTKLEFRNTIVDIFSEQRNLAQAIADADMAISKINSIAVTAMWIGVSFAAMIACGIAVENMLTLSLSTILGINVIIGDVVRSVLASIMFIIVNHPYDIGDIVLVGPPDDSEILVVQQVNLLTTIFKRWNSQELYFANHILVEKPVTNLSRSPDQWERVDFVLPSTVNEQQLDSIRDSFADFFRENNADFFSTFDMRAIVAADSGKADSDLEYIKFTIRVRCRPTNDAEKQWNRHSRLLKLVKKLTGPLGSEV
jgi:small-conductance mechanosensitive channel